MDAKAFAEVIAKTIRRALAPRDIRDKALEDRCDQLALDVGELRKRVDDLEARR